jgi:hypothetical protein
MDTLTSFWIILWILYVGVLYPSTHLSYSPGDNIRISSSEEFDREVINNITYLALEDLSKKDIHIHRKTDIYLFNSRIEYYFHMIPFSQIVALFSPAITMWDFGLKNKKLSLSTSIHFYVKSNQIKTDKNFVRILEHELVHVWQMQRYGFLNTVRMPVWIREGYAVYVAGNFNQLEQSIRRHTPFVHTKKFIELYLEKNSNFFKHTPPDYLMYGLMVKHAIEDMNISVDDLHRGKVEYETVLNSLLDKYGVERKRSK